MLRLVYDRGCTIAYLLQEAEMQCKISHAFVALLSRIVLVRDVE